MASFGGSLPFGVFICSTFAAWNFAYSGSLARPKWLLLTQKHSNSRILNPLFRYRLPLTLVNIGMEEAIDRIIEFAGILSQKRLNISYFFFFLCKSFKL